MRQAITRRAAAASVEVLDSDVRRSIFPPSRFVMTRSTFAPLILAGALACNGGSASTDSTDSNGSSSGPDTTPATDSGSTGPGSSTTDDASGSESATMGSEVPTTTTDPTTTGTTTEVSSTTEGTTTEGTTTEESSTTDETSTTEPVDPCDPNPCLEWQQCVDGVCVEPGRPGEGQVIVVEMMIDPLLSDFDAEWFELKNVSDEHLDLDGCRLVDLGVDGDDLLLDNGDPLVIAPGERMVMAKTADSAVNGGLQDVAYEFGQGFSLTNTGDVFILRCDGVDVDVVEYAPMIWPVAVGVAMQLDPGQEDAAANDAAASWCAATEVYAPMHTGTPGAANPPCG